MCFVLVGLGQHRSKLPQLDRLAQHAKCTRNHDNNSCSIRHSAGTEGRETYIRLTQTRYISTTTHNTLYNENLFSDRNNMPIYLDISSVHLPRVRVGSQVCMEHKLGTIRRHIRASWRVQLAIGTSSNQ